VLISSKAAMMCRSIARRDVVERYGSETLVSQRGKGDSDLDTRRIGR
jgi:hypothetical protein